MNHNLTAAERPKKRFCFATIPLILISVSTLILSILSVQNFPSDWRESLGKTENMYQIKGDILFFSFETLCFLGAFLLTVLLLAKVYNALLGLPILMFSAGFMLFSVANVFYAYDLTYSEENPFEYLSDALLYELPSILIMFSASVAFLTVAVYTVIVTLRKKPVPKVLRVIPAALFGLFYTPFMIYFIYSLCVYLYYDLFDLLPDLSACFSYPILPVAIILLFTWLSSPYKKDKPSQITQ